MIRFPKYLNYFYIITTIFSLCFLTSCNNDDNPESPYVKRDKKMTVLIYAIASNNLEYNLFSDKAEIIDCASQLDLENCSLLVYQVTNSYQPVLLELAKIETGEYNYKVIKEYDPEISSATVERMSEVIADMKDFIPSENYGLILWSHGTGTDFYKNVSSASLPYNSFNPDGAFGYDQNPETKKVTQLNIDELREAIPDNIFNYIWIDACYMSTIETIYELRDKCDYFIGYPTEVFEWGMPYNRVIPYILRPNPLLVTAANEFFSYYADHPNSAAHVATVAVVDMAQIENIASLCKEAYSNGIIVDKWGLLRYSRGSIGPFYDLNGYTIEESEGNLSVGPSWFEDWHNTLNKFVIFKAATPYDFNGNPIDMEQFCGIGCFIPNPDNDSPNENFYRSLDWYKAVYP